MPLQLDDLAALDAPMGPANGAPLRIALALIDEDPRQPRTEFDAAALTELAATIAERGVKQPVSVRPHPSDAGRWMLNFGARRLRASRLAGQADIPAFVDAALDSYDQVIENEQRQNLRPLELALFVQARLNAGETQAEIARRMGKSAAYVSFLTALIDAPDWLMQAYRDGRCRGIKELYALRRLHGEHGAAVEAWVGDHPAITRDGVAALQAALTGAAQASARAAESAVAQSVASGVRCEATPSRKLSPAPRAASHPPTPLRLHVEMAGEDYELMVTEAPGQAGHLYVRPLAGGPRQLVSATLLTLRGFVER
jgi:ParB family transcriptional regulator, chromosome partitioning protein